MDDATITLEKGTTLALVGESGAGKSTLARMAVGLERPDAGVGPFRGQGHRHLRVADLMAFRRRRVRMVFQDPYTALNPRMTIETSLAEPFIVHGLAPPRERRRRIERLLDDVGLPRAVLDRLPAELSGGQLRRVAITRALAPEPDVIVCDEATSALDVSVQAQILNLPIELRESRGLSYVFVSHNLPVVRLIADRIVVMRRGSVVETGKPADIFEQPREPYTKELLSVIPDVRRGPRVIRGRGTRRTLAVRATCPPPRPGR